MAELGSHELKALVENTAADRKDEFWPPSPDVEPGQEHISMDRASGIPPTGRQPEVIVLTDTDSAFNKEAPSCSSPHRGTK